MSPASDRQDFTSWLGRWQAGDSEARERVVEFVYEELRRLARSYMREERPDHTLQGTALVHEALLRVLGRRPEFRDRAHFFRAAAMAMRRILIDHARRVAAGNRIPLQAKRAIEDVTSPIFQPRVDLLELDDALNRLQQLDPAMARIVELRCFVGLTLPEVAEIQGVSESTVSREWKHAKAWLRSNLAE